MHSQLDMDGSCSITWKPKDSAQRGRLLYPSPICFPPSESILSRNVVKDVRWQLHQGRKWNMNCGASQHGMKPTSVELLLWKDPVNIRAGTFSRFLLLAGCPQILYKYLKTPDLNPVPFKSSQVLPSAISPGTWTVMQLLIIHFLVAGVNVTLNCKSLSTQTGGSWGSGLFQMLAYVRHQSCSKYRAQGL